MSFLRASLPLDNYSQSRSKYDRWPSEQPLRNWKRYTSINVNIFCFVKLVCIRAPQLKKVCLGNEVGSNMDRNEPLRLSFRTFASILHSGWIIRKILLRGFLGTHCFDTIFTGSNFVLGPALSAAWKKFIFSFQNKKFVYYFWAFFKILPIP